MFLDDGLVEADGLLVFVLHEEHVSHIELPGVVLVADLHRLAENLLHHLEVLSVPVDLGLGHQDHDVPGNKNPDGRIDSMNKDKTVEEEDSESERDVEILRMYL